MKKHLFHQYLSFKENEARRCRRLTKINKKHLRKSAQPVG